MVKKLNRRESTTETAYAVYMRIKMYVLQILWQGNLKWQVYLQMTAFQAQSATSTNYNSLKLCDSIFYITLLALSKHIASCAWCNAIKSLQMLS